MAKYFNYFPKVYYFPNQELESLDVLTNITTRFSFEQKFKENSSIYYKYTVQDGETPEIIAAKLYGSSEKHWVILNMNDIVDPLYDWPLSQRNIIKFIDSKYKSSANTGQTGLDWATKNTQAYYRIETQTDKITGTLTETKIEVDASVYANIASSSTEYTLSDKKKITIAVTKDFTTYYNYEVAENENKRLIKVLKPDLIEAVDKEFKRVISDTII
jgi:hypothetical protein